MKRPAIAAALLASTLLCPVLPAAAGAGNLVDLQIHDRDSGQLLSPIYHRGRYYVAGEPGHRYSVVMHNRTGERVLVVLSVDGVNAISGETADSGQNGYVLGPWQRAEISGWRKSLSESAEFYFTDLPDSYAARTGRPDDVGVIGAAVFRERFVPPPLPMSPPIAQRDRSESKRYRAQPAPSGAAPLAESSAEREAPADYARQELGTGHGLRRFDPVSTTRFERASARPAEVVTLYYDAWAALAARGIAPRPCCDWGPREPEPFPTGFAPTSFVPDPPYGW